MTAVDLNTGTIRWQVPFGDWPELRSNPVLANVQLPDVLGVAGPTGTMVTKGGLVFVGGGDRALHAYDETTGKELWQGELPSASHGSPMTYRSREGKQYVVIASGSGAGATLVAFSLDDATTTALANRKQ